MKEALKQLREVHAIQGRDGCWDIDDYMLGLYNGLELALSIVENRECRYKNRPKPEQEPVAWGVFDDNLHDMFFAKEEAQEMVRLKGDGSTVKPLYTTPPQRTWVDLTDDEISASSKGNMTRNGFARVLLAKLKDKNTRGQK